MTGGNDDSLAIRCDYGSHLMKKMELEIGGQRIDRQYDALALCMVSINREGAIQVVAKILYSIEWMVMGKCFYRLQLDGSPQTGTETFPNGFTLTSDGDHLHSIQQLLNYLFHFIFGFVEIPALLYH